MEKAAFIEGKIEEKGKYRLLGKLPSPSFMENKDVEIQGRKKSLKKKTKTNKHEPLSNQLDNLLDKLGFDTEVVKEPSKNDESIVFEEKTKRRRGDAMTNSTRSSTLPCITPQPKRGQLEPLTTSLNCSRTSESYSALGKTQVILSLPLPDLRVKTTKSDAMIKSTLSSTLPANKAEAESNYSSPWNRPKPPSDDEESVIEELIEGEDLSEDKKSMSEEEHDRYSSDFDSYVRGEETEGEDIERDPFLDRLSNHSEKKYGQASRFSSTCSTNEDTKSEEESHYISPLSGRKEKTMREPGRTVEKTVFLEGEEPEECKKAPLLGQLPPLKGITPRPKRVQLEPLTSLTGPCTSGLSSFLSKTQDILPPPLPVPGVQSSQSDMGLLERTSELVENSAPAKTKEEHDDYSSDFDSSVREEEIEGEDIERDPSLDTLSNHSEKNYGQASRFSSTCSTNEDTKSEEESHNISPLSGRKEKTMREPGRTVEKTVFLEGEEPEECKKAPLLGQLPPLKGITPRPKRVQLEPLTSGPCTSGLSSFLSKTQDILPPPLPVPGVQSSQSDAGLPKRTSELVENSASAITKDRLSSTLSSNKETKSMEESHYYLPLKPKPPSDNEGRVVEEVTEVEHLVEQESGEDLLKDQSIATYKAHLSPSHLKSSRLPPHNLSASFGRESAEISICHSGLSQDAELSNHSEKDEDFKMQQNIIDPVVEEEKEALMKEKQKRVQEFQDTLHRQEEEEERLLKAESEKRLKALRQSLKAQRRKEQSKLTRESEKKVVELKESLRANEDEQDLRLRQQSNAILDQFQTGIKLEQERKIIKLKAQNLKEIQELKAELLYLKEAHQREMGSITEKHEDEKALHRQQLQSRLTEEKEQLQASHSRELEKLNIEHQLNIEKLQKENSVKQSQLQEESKVLELRESQLKNKMISLQSQEKDLAEKRKCFASTEDVNQQMETLALVTYECDQLEEMKKKQQTLETYKDKAKTKIAQLKKERDRAKEESVKVKAERDWFKAECDRVRGKWEKARESCEIEQKNSKEETNSLETRVKLISLRLSELEANVSKTASEKPGPNGDPTLVLEDLETQLSFPADHRARSSSKNYWNVSSSADAIQSNKLILENNRCNCQQREASSTLNTRPANQVLSHTPLSQSSYSTPFKHSAREVNNQRLEDVTNSNNRFQSYYKPPNVLPPGDCLIEFSLDHNNDIRVYHIKS